MGQNLMLVIGKAVIKRKTGIGTLNGFERFLLSQFMVPDRVSTFLAATNVEPYLVDPKYDYELLTSSVQANLEMFEKVRQCFKADTVMVPTWMGMLPQGVAELGVKFKIEKMRVPYPVESPILSMEDVERIQPPEKASGYLKMNFDIHLEAQRKYTDTMINLAFDGPWDMAMLLRGDRYLPMDLRIHKDYTEAKDPALKEKIRRRGNPDMYPAIMDLASRISIRHVQLAKEYGLSLIGASLVDQYATKPILSFEDFSHYVLPYIQRVWNACDRKVMFGYMDNSPDSLEKLLSDRTLGITASLTNYIFHQTPEGVTLPEYDPPMFEMAKKYKKAYMYQIHGKFLRDATRDELEAVVRRICGMAVKMQVPATISIISVPPGTDLEKVNFVFNLTEKYGRY